LAKRTACRNTFLLYKCISTPAYGKIISTGHQCRLFAKGHLNGKFLVVNSKREKQQLMSSRNTLSLKASIISGEEPAKSVVGERESRREKKVGDSLDAGKKRAKCTVAVALPLRFFHVAVTVIITRQLG
jgi:hypothetical protein